MSLSHSQTRHKNLTLNPAAARRRSTRCGACCSCARRSSWLRSARPLPSGLVPLFMEALPLFMGALPLFMNVIPLFMDAMRLFTEVILLFMAGRPSQVAQLRPGLGSMLPCSGDFAVSYVVCAAHFGGKAEGVGLQRRYSGARQRGRKPTPPGTRSYQALFTSRYPPIKPYLRLGTRSCNFSVGRLLLAPLY
eukprot:3940759-Rhodomonas_salina.1